MSHFDMAASNRKAENRSDGLPVGDFEAVCCSGDHRRDCDMCNVGDGGERLPSEAESRDAGQVLEGRQLRGRMTLAQQRQVARLPSIRQVQLSRSGSRGRAEYDWTRQLCNRTEASYA